MGTANDKRLAVRDKYKTILGRNLYSQAKRDFCFKKYSDGKYYSDCSSSISLSFKEAGFPFPGNSTPNTVGMYQASALKEVPVEIKNGVIQNPEMLCLADMLLFAGTDSSRASADCVGHVEMVGEISGGKVYLYGHGSGTPRKTEMNAYCKSRFAAKTSTKIGNKGLLKVVRFIWDDSENGMSDSSVSGGAATRILRKGMAGADVKNLQSALIQLGYSCGNCGADGEFGSDTEQAVRKFQQDYGCGVDGEVGSETLAALAKALSSTSTSVNRVQIVGGKCWVRSAPNTSARQLGIAKEDQILPYGGQKSPDGWLLVAYENQNGWVSGKYGKLVD